jgi:crossover junction endodeoxyribonuclease RuvC
MRILSIDPGLSGAWAVIDTETGIMDCGDLPVAGVGASRCVVAPLLTNIVVNFKPDIAVVEVASAMPKQGVSSVFRYGRAYGCALGVLGACFVPVVPAPPNVWKKTFGLAGGDKEAARNRALSLAPGIAHLLQRKKDHHRAEALLIGLWFVDRRERMQEAAE